jgi:hypothetical protein
MTSDDPRPAEGASLDSYHRGVITRVYYGNGTGALRSHLTGREYPFCAALVDVRGPLPRIEGLREGMEVGFDLSTTARGVLVSLIRVPD